VCCGRCAGGGGGGGGGAKRVEAAGVTQVHQVGFSFTHYYSLFTFHITNEDISADQN
jgi:hypothetical protein